MRVYKIKMNKFRIKDDETGNFERKMEKALLWFDASTVLHSVLFCAFIQNYTIKLKLRLTYKSNEIIQP